MSGQGRRIRGQGGGVKVPFCQRMKKGEKKKKRRGGIYDPEYRCIFIDHLLIILSELAL